MTYKQILRYQPWLRLVDIHRISSRLLEYSRGDLFIAFNTIKNVYELHSVKSFKLSGDSYNANIDAHKVNGFILEDFKANNNNAHAFENESERLRKEYLYDKWEATRFDSAEMIALKRALGVKL